MKTTAKELAIRKAAKEYLELIQTENEVEIRHATDNFRAGVEWAYNQFISKQEALHPDSQKIFFETFDELADKMIANQEKYDYTNEWLTEDWKQQCQQNLIKHIEKGDPKDVSIYALFMIYRGRETILTPKSPQGINNGWNRIDEVGLPSENGDYWFYSETMPIQISEHYFHAKSKRCKEQTIRNHTHYQPIIKPEKPIY